MRDLLLSHTSIVILPTTRNPQIKGRILKSTTNLRSLIQSVPVKMRPSFRCENAHLPFIPAPFSDPPHLTPPHVHSALPTSMQFPWSIQWSRWSRRQRIGDVVIHSLVDSSMSRYCPLLCTIMLMDIGWIWKYGWMEILRPSVNCISPGSNRWRCVSVCSSEDCHVVSSMILNHQILQNRNMSSQKSE